VVRKTTDTIDVYRTWGSVLVGNRILAQDLACLVRNGGLVVNTTPEAFGDDSQDLAHIRERRQSRLRASITSTEARRSCGVVLLLLRAEALETITALPIHLESGPCLARMRRNVSAARLQIR
jgi:hypothetical protein